MAVNEKLSKLYKLSGTPEFQSKVKELNANIDKAIPKDARLPSSILDDLPLNVMGIPASCGLLSARELEITDLDVVALSQSKRVIDTSPCANPLTEIAAGEYTAVETVTAFGKRAAIAHQLTHCLTDIFIEEGIEQAKALDEHFKKTGKVVGPFHGVPVSVKVSLARFQRLALRATGSHVCERPLGIVRLHGDLGDVQRGRRSSRHPASSRRRFLRKDESTAGSHARRVPIVLG
jgi:hypothetical protein